ncbi:hypothetical protein [Blastococcus atacamensis]|uniref:hypothetical protein n=1 Tax=Blastococcus atacamensis TaxID=2070508 RepID=UPI000CECAF8E|nr:hypothetical protein [Blastococcus atacamensis]
MSAAPRRRRSRPVLLTLALALGAAAAVGGYLLRPTTEGAASTAGGNGAATAPSDGATEPPVDATPATGSASQPAPTVEAGPSTVPAPSQPRSADVALTYSGWDPAGAVVVGGVVLDRVEQGGRCTLVLSRGGVVLEGSGEATPDATTTACGELRVSGPELTSGPWQAVVRYSSATSAGESSAGEVMVP